MQIQQRVANADTVVKQISIKHVRGVCACVCRCVSAQTFKSLALTSDCWKGCCAAHIASSDKENLRDPWTSWTYFSCLGFVFVVKFWNTPWWNATELGFIHLQRQKKLGKVISLGKRIRATGCAESWPPVRKFERSAAGSTRIGSKESGFAFTSSHTHTLIFRECEILPCKAFYFFKVFW